MTDYITPEEIGKSMRPSAAMLPLPARRVPGSKKLVPQLQAI